MRTKLKMENGASPEKSNNLCSLKDCHKPWNLNNNNNLTLEKAVAAAAAVASNLGNNCSGRKWNCESCDEATEHRRQQQLEVGRLEEVEEGEDECRRRQQYDSRGHTLQEVSWAGVGVQKKVL